VSALMGIQQAVHAPTLVCPPTAEAAEAAVTGYLEQLGCIGVAARLLAQTHRLSSLTHMRGQSINLEKLCGLLNGAKLLVGGLGG